MHELEMREARMQEFGINNRRYLGSKYKLTDFIHGVIRENCGEIKSVMDLFGGTGVVGYSFNRECSVIVNDILTSNNFVYHTFFGNEDVSVEKLTKIISDYNLAEPSEDNYYSVNFADTYLSRQNMRKVGYVRDDIDRLFNESIINYREKCALVCSLLYAIDKSANTVGHYDAYRKNGDLSSRLVLLLPNFKDDKYNHNNKIFSEDSNELVRHVYADLVYIDPPYNSRQYCDSYHFLENVSRNEKPEVFGVAKKMERGASKSRYCTSKAPAAFADLIENISAKYILVSYSDTGTKGNDRSNAKINDVQILDILNRKGSVKVFEQEYNIFSAGKTKFSDHKERLFLCEIGGKDEASRETDGGISAKVKSPLNYTGGKYRILDQLEEKFPKDVGIFYDVFCGGANVGVNADAEKVVCIDNNRHLVSLLDYLKDAEYYDLVKHLEGLIGSYGLSNTYEKGYEFYGCTSEAGVGQYNRDHFDKLKNDYNCADGERSDLFLLLIIYSFNNQIRFNGSGKFNLPVGKRDFNSSLRTKLEKFMSALKTKNIEFSCMDFRDLDIGKVSRENAFLYLDPPYLLGNASYNENNGWSEKDDADLFNFLTECDRAHVRFALSNVIEHKGMVSDKLLSWAIENRFNINHISRSYSNSSYHVKDRTAVTKEVLITNY